MFNYRSVLKYLNRAAYFMSAAMIMAGFIFNVLPASDVAAQTQTCPEGGEWTKVGIGGDNPSYTYTIPDGKQVVEVCYKAGDNTHSYGVNPPATGSISISNDQFWNPPHNALLGLSHASFRLQNLPTPTNTAVPPTPTDTAIPPTPTDTDVPPTPTDTDVPPTPTDTDVPPTPTDTDVPPTPTNTPNTLYVILQDPYCVSIPGTLMQWVVVNNNAEPFIVLSWSIDGVMQPAGFIAPVGNSLLTQTTLGTHTVVLNWEQGSSELTWTILSCQLPDTATPTPTKTRVPPTSTPVPDTATTVPTLPIPETGGSGGPIIPVTGADLNQPLNTWFFGGFGMFGFGMILTGLRKMLDL